MGYGTQYKLRILNSKNKEPIDTLRSYSSGAYIALDNNGNRYDECKWYTSREDILAFSKLFPKLIFKLIGKGEQRNDTWKEYYKNGHWDSRLREIENK